MKTACNLHTHSTFCDGKNTPEENVLKAINGGLVALGFSSHAPYGDHCTDGCLNAENIGAYRNEILRLKEKYAPSIEILLGIEQDYFSPKIDKKNFDYVIGSVHYVKKNGEFVPIDYSYDTLKDGLDNCFSGDVRGLAREYYRTVSDIVKMTDCDIIGHFDILTKFNEKHRFFNENDIAYQSLALEAVDALLESDRIFEVNTGAVSRGWRKYPYPADFILKRIIEKHGRLIITSDAHDSEKLTFCFDETEEYLRALGARELWMYRNGRFISFVL